MGQRSEDTFSDIGLFDDEKPFTGDLWDFQDAGGPVDERRDRDRAEDERGAERGDVGDGGGGVGEDW